jgi:SAM-dependent methyltransferase
MDRGNVPETGKRLNWASAARDYADYRPGPPLSFYRHLEALGIGLPGQRTLDLGTGPGQLALQFARQRCHAAGIDPDPGQIAEGQATARREGLPVDFRVASAEQTTHPDGAFDTLTANHCWWYFDVPRVVAEAKRVLTPGGVMVVSFLAWLARMDPVVKATEELILRYNADLPMANWSGEVPSQPGWANTLCTQRGMFWYDEALPFSHESWRGRARSNRAIGASLSAEQVRRFDGELADLLRQMAPDPFTVQHRISAFVLAPK